MEKKISDWFVQRGYTGTKELERTQMGVIRIAKYGKTGVYQSIAEETGESYDTVSRSIGRGSEKLWKGEDKLFSKLDPKPKPLSILEDVAFLFKKKP